MVVYAVLIEIPNNGLVLFETGVGEDLDKVRPDRAVLSRFDSLQDWGGVLQDVFTPTNMEEQTTLPAQIKKTGHDISEVKHVVIGRMSSIPFVKARAHPVCL